MKDKQDEDIFASLHKQKKEALLNNDLNAVQIYPPDGIDDIMKKSLKTRFNRKNLKEEDPTPEEQMALELLLAQEQAKANESEDSSSIKSLSPSERLMLEQDMVKEQIKDEIVNDMNKKGIRKPVSKNKLNQILSQESDANSSEKVFEQSPVAKMSIKQASQLA